MNESNNVDQSDDPEMLAAIRAAFGEEALGMLSDDIEIGTGDDLANQQNLNELVEEIDNATLSSSGISDEAKPAPRTTEDADKHIVVQVSGRTFGIPMDNVHEIQRLPKVTFLPGVPDWILGVTNLRGNVVSVVDLQELLQLPETDAPAISKRLVMSHSLVDDIATGLVVDRVVGIRNVPKSKTLKPTSPVDDRVATFLSGVFELDENLVALLDIDKLLLSEEFRQFDAA